MWVKVHLAYNGVPLLVNLDQVENISPTAAGKATLITFASWQPDSDCQSAVYVKESLDDLELLLMQASCKPSTS